MSNSQNIDRYLAIKYPIQLVEEEDGAVTAFHPDLPGCASYGEDYSEAIKNLSEVRHAWIEGRLDAGLPIPEPDLYKQYSGKLLLRISKQLHGDLDEEAKRQGV